MVFRRRGSQRRSQRPGTGRRERLKTASTQDNRSLEGALLAALRRTGSPLGSAELSAMLGLPAAGTSLLEAALERLRQQGILVRRGRRYSLLHRGGELRGVVEVTRKGHAFVLVDGEEKGGKDVFVSRSNLGGASHGDTVALQVLGKERGRREGAITRVLDRAYTRMCGIYTAKASGGVVMPDNERLPYTVAIAGQDPLARSADGQAVLLEMLSYGSEHRPPEGKIVEVLGDPLDASVQIRMAMIAAGLDHDFPQEVLDEAASLPELKACGSDRDDLRHLPHVTIDGEDARDFDDAICVCADASGYTLYVSIADVSHYVRPGSGIDREAYRRGTSIYLPDRVLPMLPERLSNHLCSLVPEEDRPACTAILRFDQRGRRTDQRFVKSMIRSRQRLTYTAIERLFRQENGEATVPDRELAAMLLQARDLSTLLKAERLERGALEFNAPESVVRLDAGQVTAVQRAPRTQAHMLIENCMLAANEAVAEYLALAHRSVLYRIHEQPEADKLAVFTDAAKALGLELPKGAVDTRWIAAVLARAEQTPAAYLVNNLLLRSMQQARYTPDNVGHFGLGAACYLHFTSPIRRYPDLIAHRTLQVLLTGEPPSESDNLAEAGRYLSLCERRAVDLERDALARMAVLYLHDRIGEDFSATISGVGPFGLYLELQDSGISGSVPMENLRDDFYLHDSRRFRLIGERTNRIHQLGDQVLARLEEAHLAGKRLVFSLQEPGQKKGGPRGV